MQCSRTFMGIGMLLAASLAMAWPDRGAANLGWPDLLKRPKPQASARIDYGPDPLQHVDIWIPDTSAQQSPTALPALLPVVLMVHGGCWQTSVAQADLMNYAAEDLRRQGIAVWNIEYRGIDRPGGGYPGTFRDAAAAADALRANAAAYHLDTGNIVAFGHSAGGHLALWLAARGRIAPASALHSADPLPIATTISIGGLPDLKAATVPPGNTCEVDPVHRLTGSPTPARPDVYADTSPAELMPFATRQVLINGTGDKIAPPAFADAYQRRARAKGVVIRRVVVPDDGHVELIAPGSRAWKAEVSEIRRALHLPALPLLPAAHG